MRIKRFLMIAFLALTIAWIFPGCEESQESLARTAKKMGVEHTLRRQAVDKLTDQVLLTDLAKNADCLQIREMAILKLTDPALLADIAKNVESQYIRLVAVRNHRIDSAMLVDIAKHDKDGWVAEKAADMLTDQALLVDVAKNAQSGMVRRIAVRKLTDQAVLVDIAKNDPENPVRHFAVMTLTDPAMLEDLAKIDICSHCGKGCRSVKKRLEELKEQVK